MEIRAENDVLDQAKGTRSLRLVVKHPGVIWTGKLLASLAITLTHSFCGR